MRAFAFLIGLVSVIALAAFWTKRQDPNAGMELYCGTKPTGFAWLDVPPGTPIELYVDVDKDADGTVDEIWRAEGAGKLGLYWTAYPFVRYRARWEVAGVEGKPTHWFTCP
jgi:hypothetical protein